MLLVFLDVAKKCCVRKEEEAKNLGCDGGSRNRICAMKVAGATANARANRDVALLSRAGAH